MVLATESAVTSMYLCRFCPGPYVPWLRRPPPQEVPVHLQDLLETFSEELTEEQRSKLAELLTEFQDEFARS